MRPLLVLLLLLETAAAQPGLATPAPAPTVERREWYGHWTLATDAAAIAVGSGSIELGLVTYALGGPIAHVAKGNYLGAALSVSARLGLPLVLGLMGRRDDAAEEDNPHSYGISAEGAGIILGAIAASLLDAAVIARRTVEVPAWQVSVSATNGFAIGVGRAW